MGPSGNIVNLGERCEHSSIQMFSRTCVISKSIHNSILTLKEAIDLENLIAQHSKLERSYI